MSHFNLHFLIGGVLCAYFCVQMCRLMAGFSKTKAQSSLLPASELLHCLVPLVLMLGMLSVSMLLSCFTSYKPSPTFWFASSLPMLYAGAAWVVMSKNLNRRSKILKAKSLGNLEDLRQRLESERLDMGEEHYALAQKQLALAEGARRRMDKPQQVTKKRSFSIWRLAAWLAFSVSLCHLYFIHRSDQEATVGHFKAAIHDARIAMWFDPFSSSTHNNLGFYLFQDGQYPEALRECRRAVQLNGRNSYAHDSLGQVLSHTGHLDEAISECRKAIELKPNKAVYHNSLGYALYQHGEKAKARQEWQQAMELGNSEETADAQRMLTQYR